MSRSMNSLEAVEDRLSALPDPILIHIISFLPTKEAVRTVVIRRFGTLWTYLPNLNFDDSHFYELWQYEDDDNEECTNINLGFFNFVRNVLTLHQQPTVEKFSILINTAFYSYIEDAHMGHEVDSWIAFALRKQTKSLEFGFEMVEPCEVLYKLPNQNFVSDSLVDLKLVYIDIKPLSRVQMGSLRVLRLHWVSLSNEIVREVIQGCPLLKELEIYNCWDYLTELSSDNLEILKIDKDLGYCDSLTINCPKLTSFEYNGCFHCLEISNMSAGCKVNFRLTSQVPSEFREFTQFKAALREIVHVNTVSLSYEFITVLFSCIQEIENFTTCWKYLKISIWLTDRHVPGLCCLLGSSPLLEQLEIDLVVSEHQTFQLIESQLDIHLPELMRPWTSLKCIVISGSPKSSYDVPLQLAEILLRNASSLEELVISSKPRSKSSEVCDLISEQLVEFSEKLSKLSRVSKHARLTLSCANSTNVITSRKNTQMFHYL